MSAPMPTTRNVYRAAVLSNYDGDTFRARLEVLPGLYHEGRIRLARVNAPELSTSAGVIAAAWTAAWLAGAPYPINPALTYATGRETWPLMIQATTLDNYGRILGETWRTMDGRNLSDDLLASGNAVVMNLAAQLVAP